jgi:hypothetical protein
VPDEAPSETQLAGLLAVQPQLDAVVTVSVPFVPPADGVKLAGDTLKLHDCAAWETATVLPATVRDVVRVPLPVFAVTL